MLLPVILLESPGDRTVDVFSPLTPSIAGYRHPVASHAAYVLRERGVCTWHSEYARMCTVSVHCMSFQQPSLCQDSSSVRRVCSRMGPCACLPDVATEASQTLSCRYWSREHRIILAVTVCPSLSVSSVPPSSPAALSLYAVSTPTGRSD